jgi:hypothetical protein
MEYLEESDLSTFPATVPLNQLGGAVWEDHG